jgi:hypothetical protein
MTEFDDVIQLLKDERPQATELELDAIKQRVRRNAAKPSRRSQSMKSRLAILGMLVTGMLFSTAGAGLAISGVTQSNDNAAVSQYATATPTPTVVCTPTPTGENNNGGGGGTNNAASENCGEGGVLPAEETNAPSNETAPSSSTKPAEESGGGVSPAEETQPVRQQAAAAQTSQLPFTGFAAIPVLLGGLALLSGGLVLRRRTRSE